MAKLILSAFADEYSKDFEEQCRGMRELGVEYIEIRGVDGKNVSDLNDEDVARVKSTLAKYGIKISTIGSPLGKIKVDGDMDAHLAKAERVFQIARELDTKYVRMFSFYLPDGKTREECRSDVLAAVGKLLDLADKYGVTLCHENEGNIYGESPADGYDVISYFGGRLKCVLDMGNYVLKNHNPTEAYEKLGDYIQYFHIKDALYSGSVVPPGCGEANIQGILAAYKASDKPDTFVSLEPHLHNFVGLSALGDKCFDTPYRYDTQADSFKDALVRLKELI